jgi:hypothetical protein
VTGKTNTAYVAPMQPVGLTSGAVNRLANRGSERVHVATRIALHVTTN